MTTPCPVLGGGWSGYSRVGHYTQAPYPSPRCLRVGVLIAQGWDFVAWVVAHLVLEGRCLGHTRVGYRLLKGRTKSLGGVAMHPSTTQGKVDAA